MKVGRETSRQQIRALLFGALLAFAPVVRAQLSLVPSATNPVPAGINTLPLMTNIQRIVTMGNAGARETQYWAKVQGVITFMIPGTVWVFIHDENAGMVVTFADRQFRPEIGQLIEAEGPLRPGGFTPYIVRGKARVLGHAPMPRPKMADPAKLFVGDDYARYVTLRGYIRDLGLGAGYLTMLVSDGGYRFQVQAVAPKGTQFPRDWLDAEVEVTGVVQTHAIASGHPNGFILYGASTNMVRMLARAPESSSNLFERPLRKISELSSSRMLPKTRVKVRGVVTLHQPSSHIFIQDLTGAIEVQPMQVLSGKEIQDGHVGHPPQGRLSPGDRIDVVGVPLWHQRGLFLFDAEYEKIGAGPEIVPVAVTAGELLDGSHNSQLVTLKGRLIDREYRSRAAGLSTQILILESDDQIFEASWNVSGPGSLPVKERSYLQVTGVASTRSGDLRVRRSSFLLLRGPEDVQFLGEPALWRRPEVVRTVAIVGIIAIIGLATILLLKRQVGRQTLALVEANRQLQHQINERTRAEERVAQALDAERELNRLKSNFVSMVSHEFRTPLGTIQSSAELLADYSERLPPERRERLLRSIVESTQDMAHIMEEVLLLSRVESAQYKCQPELFDLTELCQRLVNELHHATERRCPIELTVGLLLDKVCADPVLLRHVFVNLLSNAVKYSPPGETIEFAVERRDHEAVFTIRDHGIGIPPDDLERLFSAFFRGGNTEGIPGTGLGLVIVKRCVDLHNGQVSLRSKPGVGTTATVRLPLFIDEAESGRLQESEASR